MGHLFNLSKSRVRHDLLLLFFSNSRRSFYLRELQRITGHSAGNIQREIRGLKEDSVLIPHRKGNSICYEINPKYPLLKELKSIIAKTIGVDQKLKKLVNSVQGIKSAFIYGSHARDRDTAASDIDLVVVGTPDEAVLTRGIKRNEKLIRREINFQAYTETEYKNELKTKGSFLSIVAYGKRIILKGAPDGG